MTALARGLLVGAIFLGGSAFGRAEAIIQVEMHQAKVIKLSQPADTIVVGDPEIADASVQDSTTIVLTGKGFGQTNLVVLGADGSPIIDQQVSVSRSDTGIVRIYRRARVQTVHCSPFCEGAYRSEAEVVSDNAMSTGN